MSRRARVPVPTTALDQDSTLVVVLELSARSWLAAARVPGVGRLSRYALAPSVAALADWLRTAKARAGAAGRTVSRVVLAYEAGRDGFWLARYLNARGVEVYVIQPSSVLVDRRARRAKTDALARRKTGEIGPDLQDVANLKAPRPPMRWLSFRRPATSPTVSVGFSEPRPDKLEAGSQWPSHHIGHVRRRPGPSRCRGMASRSCTDLKYKEKTHEAWPLW